MKRVIMLLAIFSFSCGLLHAQMPTINDISKRLTIGYSVYTDLWQNLPDSVASKTINQGSEVFIHYYFPMTKSGSVKFFMGGGLSSHNLYLKRAALGYNSENMPYFYNLPEKINEKDLKIKNSKVSLTYFDIPFGFEFKFKKDFHATLGFKVGWNINSLYKYTGNDLIDNEITIKTKEKKLQHIQKMHYGPMVAVGYKWFGLKATYQLVPIFDENSNLNVYPISVGIVFKPFK